MRPDSHGAADARAGLMGGGAVAVVFAVSLFSPSLVPPLAAVAGWPLERRREYFDWNDATGKVVLKRTEIRTPVKR